MPASTSGLLVALAGLRLCLAWPGADSGGRAGALLQTWNAALDGAGGRAKDTPVTRVVNLLKDMSKTLQAEADEDEKLYEKLKCWCESNSWEKGNAVEASKAKIEQLEADIESGTAKVGELKATIADVKAKTESDKKALAEATATRQKQQEEFHGMEVDSIQAIENLKAAIEVLAKHQGGDNAHPGELEGASLPQLSMFSLLGTSARGKQGPWTGDHDNREMERSLDDFMRRGGFYDAERPAGEVGAHKFLQQGSAGAASTGSWSPQDTATVRKALKSAAVFAQAHHSSVYMPAYNAQSGEIVGILKQLKEDMSADLGEAQKEEAARAEAFEELRSAKTAEIEAGEKMEEQKEDELATTTMNLAEAKEDLTQEKASLAENEKFLGNMQATCETADKDFEERKKARLMEIEAVAQTIEILTEDEARDAMGGTYSFLQKVSRGADARKQAAEKLRQAAKKAGSPQLSILATSVELDAFTKVKKAIDDMIASLKVQQTDEVKKNDWCKAELQSNEMTTAKTEDRKSDLQAKANELESTIKTLEEEILSATKQISQAQVELQSASFERKAANVDFQKTVGDQMVTIEVLKKALARLSKYYDEAALLQRSKQTSRQDPEPGTVAPVAQMEYKPSSGAAGVMQMIEKLVSDAKALMADAKKSETEAQKAYEQIVRDTNGAVLALQKQVATKSKAKAKDTKDKLQTESDVTDTVLELEDLSKMKIDLHAECDYVMHNFDTRQDARSQEIEALQQAKQILSGASMS